MKKKCVTLLMFVLISSTVFAQADKEYSKTLKKMFEVSGTEETYAVAIEQMFSMFKQQYTDVSADLWDDFKKEFLKTSLNDLTEMLVPVYFKYFTKEDLEEIIKFYESPIGKKYALNTPMITKDAMEIGQQWGMKIGQKFEKMIKEKKYE